MQKRTKKYKHEITTYPQPRSHTNMKIQLTYHRALGKCKAPTFGAQDGAKMLQVRAKGLKLEPRCPKIEPRCPQEGTEKLQVGATKAINQPNNPTTRGRKDEGMKGRQAERTKNKRPGGMREAIKSDAYLAYACRVRYKEELNIPDSESSIL